MRRITVIALGAALLVTTVWVVRGAAGPTTGSPPAAATAGAQRGQSELEHHMPHQHPATATTGDARRLAAQLAVGRLATARYATNLGAAKAAGYQILTRMIPDMGWHFLNPTIQGFDIRKPPILVYERHGGAWQLAAFEWVFPTTPTTPTTPARPTGRSAPPATTRTGPSCSSRPGPVPAHQPRDGRAVQLLASGPGDPARVAVVPNSAGLYNGTNPWIQPFNRGEANPVTTGQVALLPLGRRS